MFRNSLERQLAVLGLEHADTLHAASSLATSLQNQGKHAEAEPLVCATLAIQQRVLGDGHTHTLATATNFAALLINTGQHAAAKELGRGTLAQAHRTLGPDHPTSLRIACNLATALAHQVQTPAAVALLTATLATQRPNEPPKSCAILLTNLLFFQSLIPKPCLSTVGNVVYLAPLRSVQFSST